MDTVDILIYVAIIIVAIVSAMGKKKPLKNPMPKQQPKFDNSASMPPPVSQSKSSTISSQYAETVNTPISPAFRFEGGISHKSIEDSGNSIYTDSHNDLREDTDWKKAIIASEILKTKF